MTVQELIDTLNQLPQYQRQFEVRVEAEGVHDTHINRVELRNLGGACIGIVVDEDFVMGDDDGFDGEWIDPRPTVGA